MIVNPNIFRAYDIRGVYPDDLNEKVASRIALAFALLYPGAKKIVLARDSRLSSPALAKAITGALIGAGKEVIDIKIAPDPLFYFSIFYYRFDGGIMISGSHNPKEYNGLTLNIRKSKKEQSHDVIGEGLVRIKGLVTSEKEFKLSPRKGKITQLNPENDYIRQVKRKIRLKKPLKIIIDSGNGAMGFFPERVFRNLGCKIKTLYGEFDGNFPYHLPDPYLEDNLKDIKQAVVKNKADLGFSYDCDGDRVALIDNLGRTVNGDFCLLMLANQAIGKKKGPIVHCMRVSKAFLDEMQKQGVKTYFSISHHSAVIDKILKTKAIFGGEVTMHFFFPGDYYLCDDALFASLKLAEIASGLTSLAEFVDGLPHYSASPEIFIDTPDEEKFKIIKRLQDYLRKNRYNFIDVDGARINFNHGWALARAANTTPIIKCRFEGDTKPHLIEIERKALAIFKKVGIPVTKRTYRELGLA